MTTTRTTSKNFFADILYLFSTFKKLLKIFRNLFKRNVVIIVSDSDNGGDNDSDDSNNG